MILDLIEYPKCTTCTRARKYLEEKGINYQSRNIKEQNPTEDEIRNWHIKSKLPLKKFFNTSGLVYKELELSKKLKDMSEDEQYKILASNGMLVKRPIIISKENVFVGFIEKEWETLK